MTSLFVNTSNTQNNQLEYPSLNISDTIERECLSVLHKLHDQVNGLQLVQVVVQPLAKLFNPASLAALAASSSHHQQHLPNQSPPSYKFSNISNNPSSNIHNQNTSGSQHSNASTPSSQHPPTIEYDATNVVISSSTGVTHPAGNLPNHSRSHSVASSFGLGGHGSTSANVSGSPLTAPSNSSTYMMSPDTAQALIARLDTERDVNWLMEIIGYGLSMPFSLTGEQDSVKDCCTIYCEWLASALLPYDENNDDSKYQQLSKLVPVPIRKDPNRYARKMLSHLYNVFLPRQTLAPVSSTTYSNSSSTNSNVKNSNYQKDESDAILTAVSRQAVLCHRVLRTIESIAHNQTNLMDIETWQHLLALLLTVNDKLLSPPTEPDDIGTQLHDRILGVLFDLMLLASSQSIPEASLWKTFHKMCVNWRHRPALVDHWRRITSLLTKRIVLLPKIKAELQQNRQQQPQSHTSERSCTNPMEISITTMSYEVLSQSWYRFLNLIGNLVELSDPNIISRTDEFYHASCLANSVLDPRQHPCLNVLPQIFLNSMLGLKEYIDLFLLNSRDVSNQLQSHKPNQSTRANQQQQSDQAATLSSALSQLSLNSDRPKCNSILHIFGDWLFSAALIGSELTQEIDNGDHSSDVQQQSADISDQANMTESTISVASSTATATESGFPGLAYSPLFSRRQSHQSTTSSHTSISTGRGRRQSKQLDPGAISGGEKITLEPSLSTESFESGQAEAMATLCKIFASKSPTEDILPTYLARFYLCIQHCLNFGIGQDPKQPDQLLGPIKRQLLASVLTNSTAILQRDLDGINLLIPSFIKAIEFVFECSEKFECTIPIQPPPRQHGTRSGSIRQAANNQNNVTSFELRRASILTLVNLVAYPLHFQDLAIRNCLDGTSPTTTFSSLRPRMLKLLFIALQTEKDVTNMQILFAGLSLAIHDLASNRSCIEHNSNKATGKQQTESSHSSLDLAASACAKQSEDTVSQNSFVFNSNDGFLIKSLHVTCHLLINIWKHDNLVSLAALEVLTTIARVSTSLDSLSTQTNVSTGSVASSNANNNNIEMKNEYMQTTKWICDYICNQCSRPPPAHSRDMHSTIVAAYQCLSVWIYNHPYLLQNNQCVNTLMEVIELGVTGQKSKVTSMNPIGVAAHTILSKSDKQLKPSSMRVREAAESLLNICLVRSCHDGFRNIAACDTVLDELDIAELFSGSKAGLKQDSEAKHLEAYKSFEYFSDEDSIIFALFEGANQKQQQQENMDTATRDSVICLLRTPFGRHCWKMKFNYHSDKAREKIISNKTLGLIKRPFQQQCTTPMTENRMFTFPKGHNKSLYFNQSARFFPESIENVTSTELDRTVTTLDDYVNNLSRQIDPKLKGDLDKMNKIFAHQVLAEQKVISECSVKIKRVDCEEPQQITDIETSRLLTAHLGLENALSSLTNGVEVSTKFVDNLRELDSQSIRTCDSVNIFYVRRNRTAPMDIIESVRARHNISLDFFKWLLELGQPVVAKEHSRWAGKTNHSTRPSHVVNLQKRNLTDDHSSLTRNQMLTSYHGGAIFDGDRMLLYWSDMCQELAFLVPHRLEKINSNIIICWLESSDDLSNVPCEALLFEQHNTSSAIQGDKMYLSSAGEGDLPSFSNKNQAKASSADSIKYFISPMKNGLFKINLITSCGRQWLALPLIDGMTVSKATLASLLRESILNMCRRRRLDADSYQPPHVRRRLKIQEICNSHKISRHHESSKFYSNLFRSKASS